MASEDPHSWQKAFPISFLVPHSGQCISYTPSRVAQPALAVGRVRQSLQRDLASPVELESRCRHGSASRVTDCGASPLPCPLAAAASPTQDSGIAVSCRAVKGSISVPIQTRLDDRLADHPEEEAEQEGTDSAPVTSGGYLHLLGILPQPPVGHDGHKQEPR